ncbi:CO dehydrogenase/acetyl-CoA synthase subunit delta [Methanimicrococcus blatticola]|uniref:Acetyl-CoA decarbonylase/synthase complex subunit delta n=1 Tax=Methanimicrococcus blatticola TaxID=91560 RepID=A0A484F5U4_9EURY|nr:CO dehydrogenase/acetyl-CoA synthase subunit delta [Methanimicrococcus blatticola]MBZ3935642.1 CO dehydrogenase/acetyl-CoA synthase subunit delta [Methanimicrococcus blatticola]MCC2509284.1 CO dehydrogenase/acetyl-CoA synthase subunit delta [Methanimicrococcus blatticola]TDQ69352.1 acetyl-CoA decarbonylase/synthase delta subunit [Methanimicrococcus blatticola]
MTRKMRYSDLEKLFQILQTEGKTDLQLSDLSGAKGDEKELLARISQISSLLGCETDSELEALLSNAYPVSDTLAAAKFNVADFTQFKQSIQEVTLGAGSRKKPFVIGGEKTMPYFFDAAMPNINRVTMDVFDMPVGLAKSVRSNYEDVLEDPAAWAKKSVNEFGADMITIHLVSTDPAIKDTSAKEAAKTVEEILQAVDVPIVIGGSGNPQKDPEVLEKAAEAAEGERALIASANLNMDYQRVGNAAKKYGHVILSWTQMDINAQKELNRKLFRQCGIEQDGLIMDPTTAALGYGLDYAYSNMERIRMAGLTGDAELAYPLSSGTTNAWGAREAWMIASPQAADSDWGDREYRGPIWEIITGMTLALAGNDLFMMMHPKAVQFLKEFTGILGNASTVDSEMNDDWLTEVY